MVYLSTVPWLCQLLPILKRACYPPMLLYWLLRWDMQFRIIMLLCHLVDSPITNNILSSTMPPSKIHRYQPKVLSSEHSMPRHWKHLLLISILGSIYKLSGYWHYLLYWHYYETNNKQNIKLWSFYFTDNNYIYFYYLYINVW